MKLRRLIFICVLFSTVFACQPAAFEDQVLATPPKTPQTTSIAAALEHPTNTPSTLPAPTVTNTILPSPTALPTITLTPTPKPSPTTIPKIILTFTGQIVPARCVQAGIEKYGNADYIFADVHDLLMRSDLTIGTLNASLSSYPPTTGCTPTFVLIGRPESAAAMHNTGFDVMSVATNHIKNCGITTCGDRAFLDTLDSLKNAGIMPVGAGLNLADALKPVFIEVQGIRFGFVSLGQIEANAFATESTPGIAVLNPDNLISAIKEARQFADVVIALPHWGPEYSIYPNPSQKKLAQVAVDAGADLIIGNHTHVIQAFTELSGVPVFYGLGNFVFDQTWDRENQQSIIVQVTFNGSRLESYQITPVWADMEGKVYIADTEEAEMILARLQRANETLK